MWPQLASCVPQTVRDVYFKVEASSAFECLQWYTIRIVAATDLKLPPSTAQAMTSAPQLCVWCSNKPKLVDGVNDFVLELASIHLLYDVLSLLVIFNDLTQDADTGLGVEPLARCAWYMYRNL